MDTESKSFCKLLLFIHSPAPLCNVFSVIKGRGRGRVALSQWWRVNLAGGVRPPFVHLLTERDGAMQT